MTMTARIALTALACAALTACGPLREADGQRAGVLAVRDIVTGAFSDPPPPEKVAITRAMVDQLPGDILVVEAYEGTTRVLMVPAASNLNRVTWLSEDNVSITTENGLVIATRGFPRDLMAADVLESRRAILQGGGTEVRTHETLSDLDGISTELLQCRIAPEAAEIISVVERPVQTLRFAEACDGETYDFTNTYWVDLSGTIIRSRQFVSPETGFLLLERP